VAYADAPRFATAHRKISRRIMFRDSSRLQGGIPTMREDGGKRGEGKCEIFTSIAGHLRN
jgi:hypothetical protein